MNTPLSSAHSPGESSSWVLFGLNLRTLGQDWLHAMQQLHRLPPLRWFELNPRVQLLRADHSSATWHAGRLRADERGAADQAQAWAVELPEALLLRRRLVLPELPAAQVRDAVALDISSSSPFAEADLAWGFSQRRSDAGLEIDTAFASREQIAQYLKATSQETQWPIERSEVWAFVPGQQQPIVLQGYAEGATEQARNARRLKAWLALAFLALLGGALAVTPTLQLRNQVMQADQAYQQLQAQTARLGAERATFTAAMEDLAQIKTAVEQRVNPLKVLDLLSEVLPTDVSVSTLEWTDAAIDLTAEADNAAAIIQLLSEQELFSEVRTTRPVQQVPRANKERFSVQLRIAPGAMNTGYSDEALPPLQDAEDEADAADDAPAPQAAAPAPANAAPPQPAAPAAPRRTGTPADAGEAAPPQRGGAGTSGVAPASASQLTPASLPVNRTLAGQPPPGGRTTEAPPPEAEEAAEDGPDEPGEPNEQEQPR